MSRKRQPADERETRQTEEQKEGGMEQPETAEQWQAAEASGAEQPAAAPAQEPVVAELLRDLENVRRALAESEKQCREYLDGWQRERANFENYRKRMARELDDAGLGAKVELIRKILPAIDNLERALSDESADADVVRQGVRMTHEQLLAALAQEGLKVVPSTGHPFDPHVHEAVDAVTGTEHAADTVVEDVQKGYVLGERLVRPARVRVAR